LKTPTIPRFKTSAGSQFYFELKQNVEEYFTAKRISKFGNTKMVMKSIVLLSSYFGLYIGILTLGLPMWAMWLMCALMGFAMAGVGMGVMHDANHGSYSKLKGVNKVLARTADILGVSSNNWNNQHNKLHHTFTNIYEHDGDVNGHGLVRFTPEAPRKKLHRFQHIYWVALYGLMTIGWFFKDVIEYKNFRKRGLNRSQGKKKVMEFSEIILFKILYVLYTVVVPMLVLDIALWQALVGLMTIHFVSGLVLSVIFQLAHVVDKLDHEQGPDINNLDEWAVHQINHTFNFATNSKVVSWYCGGLNFQIEHHLFPNICHIHYPHLNKIIKKTAEKHGIAYQEFNTFWDAFVSHLRFLKQLGQPIPVRA
jgi:linoleoyl-CoA desaturase